MKKHSDSDELRKEYTLEDFPGGLTAERLGVSRSELYVNAVRDYLERHRAENITARLNEVYSDVDSSIDQHIQRMQLETLEKEDW